MATIPNMSELGSSGLVHNHGTVNEEFLREWQGYRKCRTIAEMQQDAVIAGVLLAIELSLRQVKCDVKPADDTPQADEVKQFVEECLGDMSSSWADILSEILTMLPYGYSYLETVYKRRAGDNKDTGKSSKYTDGRIGWRKWAIRSQDSLDRWEFDDEGGLAGMWQIQPMGAPVLIPIEKALLFRGNVHKNNPEGKSILRSSYIPWYYKKNISRIEAIGIERDLGGLPVIYMPPNYLSSTATAGEQALYATMKELVTNIRRDEQEGVIMPQFYDESGNKQFELQLLTSGGARQFDIDKVVARYDQRITMSMLADFIMLGHEAVGSYALSATKASMFKTALEAWLQAIADVINTHAIPRLLRLNGIAMELAPCMKFGSVGEVELLDVNEFLKSATVAGMQMFPDMELENHLRTILGFPQIDEEQFTEREATKQAEKDTAVAIQREAINAKSQGNNGQQQQGARYSEAERQVHDDAIERIIARGYAGA